MPRPKISTNLSFCANTTPTNCSGSTRSTTHCNQADAQPSTRFCGQETQLSPRAALTAFKPSRCDSLRLVLMLCLPKPSASRGQRSTQNTKKPSCRTSLKNTLFTVQCAHDKWLTNENWLNNRCVLCAPACSHSSLCCLRLHLSTPPSHHNLPSFVMNFAAAGSAKVTSSPHLST